MGEDDFIIRNAIRTQGIIVSNDNFLDGELWLPSDPLGKNQGSLETFLHRPMIPPTELMEELNMFLTPPRQQTDPSLPQATDSDIPQDLLDILYSEEGGRGRNGAGEDESDSEDGWKAAFYSQPNSNCVYIDYNKGINPNP